MKKGLLGAIIGVVIALVGIIYYVAEHQAEIEKLLGRAKAYLE